jgi:hypothetical protein
MYHHRISGFEAAKILQICASSSCQTRANCSVSAAPEQECGWGASDARRALIVVKNDKVA